MAVLGSDRRGGLYDFCHWRVHTDHQISDVSSTSCERGCGQSSQTEDVRSPGRSPTCSDLGRYVIGAPGLRPVTPFSYARWQEREAGQVGVSVCVQEDIFRLDVAVHHSSPVCCVEGIGDTVDHITQLMAFERPTSQGVGEVSSLHQSTDQISGTGLPPVVI